MKSKNHFYTKFINEENLKNIGDIYIQRKYCKHSFLVPIFLGESVLLITFVGYNFENPFSICIFSFVVLYILIALYSSISLFLLDKKYHVFKRKLNLVLLHGVHYLLAIAFLISAIFTTKFTSYPDYSFIVEFNPAFFFLIYLPLYFAHFIFCYYAFIECFGRYTKTGMRHYNGLNQQGKSNQKYKE